MSRNLVRGIVFITAIAVALPPPSFAQPKPIPVAEAGVTEFNVEQLDAMLAPIALFPNELNPLPPAACAVAKHAAASATIGISTQCSLIRPCRSASRNIPVLRQIGARPTT
jgi:hypothetical protein